MGKAPLLQLKACSTENVFPQMQLVGRKGGVQPYLRKIASLNALLCRVKPMFSMGSAVNQVEAPFSPARDRDLCWLAERTSFRFCRSSFCLDLPFLTLQNVSAFSDLLLSGGAVLGALVNIEQS